MKHADAERIASALILAVLIHLVIGVILAFTVPWQSEREDEYLEPIRVVFDEPPVTEPPPEEAEPPEPAAEPTVEPPSESDEPTPAPEESPAREAPASERPARETPAREAPASRAPNDAPAAPESGSATGQAERWDIPESAAEPSQPAAPPPERTINPQALRQESIPEGPSGEYARQQREEMERRFAALEEEISEIDRLQEELISARESAAPGSESSAEIDRLQRRLDQALSDLSRPGDEDAVVRVGPEGDPAGTEAAAADGPRTSGGRGLVAGDPRPDFSRVRWREGVPGEVVITVRFWVNRAGTVVDHEYTPADLTLLARSGLREAIDRTVGGWRFQTAPNASASEAGRVVYVIER